MVAWIKKLNVNKKNYRQKRFRRLLFNRLHFERGLRILPNLFTLANASVGFCSVVFASYGEFVAAAYFILLGALMDSLDGRIARYAKVTSEFGIQLDSLCDGITFCLAPAILVYFWQLRLIGIIGMTACILFLLAGLLRLARFNITHVQQSIFFRGIPTPIAGCFLATLVLNSKMAILPPSRLALLLGLVLLLASLMVSPLPFPTFKKMPRTLITLFIGGFFATTIMLGFTRVLLLLFIIYFFVSIEEYVRAKAQKPPLFS